MPGCYAGDLLCQCIRRFLAGKNGGKPAVDCRSDLLSVYVFFRPGGNGEKWLSVGGGETKKESCVHTLDDRGVDPDRISGSVMVEMGFVSARFHRNNQYCSMYNYNAKGENT